MVYISSIRVGISLICSPLYLYHIKISLTHNKQPINIFEKKKGKKERRGKKRGEGGKEGRKEARKVNEEGREREKRGKERRREKRRQQLLRFLRRSAAQIVNFLVLHLRMESVFEA